jgi:death-on-curing protein
VSRFIVDTHQERLIATYGGAGGVRDDGLIESALARPLNRWHYEPDADVFDLAAGYGFGLARNHGYVDGNKRIAFMTMGVFLYLNGWLLEAAEAEAVHVMLRVAAGEWGESELAEWLRGHVVPVPA